MNGGCWDSPLIIMKWIIPSRSEAPVIHKNQNPSLSNGLDHLSNGHYDFGDFDRPEPLDKWELLCFFVYVFFSTNMSKKYGFAIGRLV